MIQRGRRREHSSSVAECHAGERDGDASAVTAWNRHRRLAAIGTAVIAVLFLPALAAAHPLGNFTINHYAGIRIEADRIQLDVVIDQAEIPAFQARLGFDTDGDGAL